MSLPYALAIPIGSVPLREPRKQAWGHLGWAAVRVRTFVIPWGDMVLLPYLVQASRVFTLLVGAFWLFATARGLELPLPEITHWAMPLFIVCTASKLLWIPEPEKSLRRILSYSQLFLGTVVVKQATRAPLQYHSLLVASLAAAMIAAHRKLTKAYRGLQGKRQPPKGYSYVSQTVWA